MTNVKEPSDPLILFIGRILPPEKQDRLNVVQIQFGRDRIIEAPIELTNFLEFVKGARLESEVIAWIKDTQDLTIDLENMISEKKLIRLSGTASEQLQTLKGLQLAPLSYRFSLTDRDDFLTVEDLLRNYNVKSVPSFVVSTLAYAMWNSPEKEDLPALLNRTTKHSKYLPEDVDELIIYHIKRLLTENLAWLAPMRPKQKSLLHRFFKR